MCRFGDGLEGGRVLVRIGGGVDGGEGLTNSGTTTEFEPVSTEEGNGEGCDIWGDAANYHGEFWIGVLFFCHCCYWCWMEGRVRSCRVL